MRARVTPERGEYVKGTEIYCKATAVPSPDESSPDGERPRCEGGMSQFAAGRQTITERGTRRVPLSVIDKSTAHGSDIVRC